MSNKTKKKFKPIGENVENFDEKLNNHIDDNKLWQKLSNEEKELDRLEDEIEKLKELKKATNFLGKIKINFEIRKKKNLLKIKKDKWMASAMPNFFKEAMKDE